MPESCRRVIRVLDRCSYASQKEICGKTGLSIRSVKSAVKLLLFYGAICEFSAISDMRRKIYGRDENGKR